MVAEVGGFKANDRVWDLYCGVGTIGLFLAIHAKVREVIGVEDCEPAVRDAEANRLENSITNARFLCGKAEEVPASHMHLRTHSNTLEHPQNSLKSLPFYMFIYMFIYIYIYIQVMESTACRPNPEDVCVLNPPRKGCAASLLKRVAQCEVGRLVYISCNPTTLARDLRLLLAQGYILRSVTPVDMFPQSYHVEAVAALEKRV